MDIQGLFQQFENYSKPIKKSNKKKYKTIYTKTRQTRQEIYKHNKAIKNIRG
jgi:hypothetical protein